LLTLAGELELDNPGSVQLSSAVMADLLELVGRGSAVDRHGFLSKGV
jgi:hypothetical protein